MQNCVKFNVTGFAIWFWCVCGFAVYIFAVMILTEITLVLSVIDLTLGILGR